MDILLGTSNPGKIVELKYALQTTPNLNLLTLEDLPERIPEPDEPYDTLEANAIHKAKYYADKTGLVTLSDDGGIFIDALQGWPGVHSARIASTSEERWNMVFEKLSGKIELERAATFKAVLAVYDPMRKESFIGYGETRGRVLEEPIKTSVGGFGYDPIFYVDVAEKSYAEMTVDEKNGLSHRGKALVRVKYYLKNQYDGKHFIVPVALIIKDGKILMNLRNDPHQPKYHKKWEFPGGGVEMGEGIEECVVREVKEEAGYDVRVVKQLSHIGTEEVFLPEKNVHYQVYLIAYLCEVVSGDGVFNDEEVLESRWFELDEVLKYDLMGTNAEMYKIWLPEIKYFFK